MVRVEVFMMNGKLWYVDPRTKKITAAPEGTRLGARIEIE